MRQLKALVVVLILFAVPSYGRAQSAAPADLDAYVVRAMKTFEVPGLALTIVKDGQVVVFSFDFQDLLLRPAPAQ